MIAEKVLGNMHQAAVEGEVIPVPFAWFEVEKKRIVKTASDGTEFGVCIGDGVKDGDILACQDGKIYVVQVQPSPIIQVEVNSMQQMGRLCFELGNRHLSLRIESDCVMVPYDEPTLLYLQKLGFNARKVEAVFSDYIVCKAHGDSGHSHSHSHSHAQEHHHHA